jgi:hypothetical protein
MSVIKINILDLDNKLCGNLNLNVYENDTKTTFIERIVYNLNTIKEYLKFEESEMDEKENIYFVHSLLTDITDYVYDSETLDIFLNKMLKLYQNIDLLSLVKLLYFYNKKFKDFDVDDLYNINIVIYPSIDILIKLGITKSQFDLEEFIKVKKDRFIQDFLDKVDIQKKKALLYIKNYKLYDEIIPMDLDIKSTKNKSMLKIKTNITTNNFTLNSIFSNVICNEDVPFCAFSGIYKIYEDVNINTLNIKERDKEYCESSRMITMKIKIIENEMADCYINFQEGSLRFGLKIDYSVIKNEKMVRDTTDKILKSIPNIDIKTEKEEEISIIQTSIVSNKSFYHYVLSDIIMNNPIFSEYLTVDESIKSSKLKSGLYTTFFIKDSVGKSNISVIDDTTKFPVVKSIRLRIKNAQNIELIEKFILMFRKLMTIYEKEEDEIIEFYKKYIKDFPEIKEEKEKKKKLTLYDQVSDLFLKTDGGYAKKCQNPPIIIDEKESVKYKKDYVMKYPTKGEGVPHYYKCDNSKYKYVGLRQNTMKNKDVYKYIPCCYLTSQIYKKSYRNYFYEEKIEEKTAQQNILKTNKFAQYGEFALVPKNIKDLLDFLNIYDSTRYKYVRMGVNETFMSLLECVLDSSDYEINYENSTIKYRDLKKELKLPYLNKEYEKLLNYKNIAVASQENPGLNETEIRNKLENQKNYMNPRHWTKLLETVYNCKIIVFYRNKKDTNSSISIPNHELVYLQEKPVHKKLLLLYEHYGSEVSYEYPRCEIIMTSDNEKNIKLKQGLIYNYTEDNFDKIYDFYKNQLQQYYYNFSENKLKKIVNFELYQLYYLSPSHQIIDNYGKARGIVVNEIIFFTDPFPPLNIPSYKDLYYKDFDKKQVVELAKKYNFIINNNTKNNDSEMKLYFPYNKMNFIVKIINKENDKEKCISYPCFNNFIKELNSYQRMAFILSEYFLYYYSLFIYESKLNPQNIETIKKFISKKTIIQETNYIMPNTPKLSIDILSKNNFIYFNDKFIIDHQETLKRLVYTLRTRIINNLNSVINYRSIPEIYNFYNDVNYYKSSNTNIVVNNLEFLNKIDNRVYTELVPLKREFFFSNKKLNNDNPILLKECDNKIEAFVESTKWIKNKSFDDNVMPYYNTDLFLYKSKNNIKVYKKRSKENEESAKVLKYKLDGKKHYLAMAEL